MWGQHTCSVYHYIKSQNQKLGRQNYQILHVYVQLLKICPLFICLCLYFVQWCSVLYHIHYALLCSHTMTAQCFVDTWMLPLSLDIGKVIIQRCGILHSQMACESLLEHAEMRDIMSEQPELCQSYRYVSWHTNVSVALHSGISHSGYCTETQLTSV